MLGAQAAECLVRGRARVRVRVRDRVRVRARARVRIRAKVRVRARVRANQGGHRLLVRCRRAPQAREQRRADPLDLV